MGYYNALMDPAQIGQGIQNAIMMGAQHRALSEYGKDPSMDSARGVMDLNPELGIRLQEREQDRQAAESDAARTKLETIAKLSQSVKDEPTYQRALQIAQQLGIDTTGAPPNYDPNWVAQQQQTYAFFAGQQGQEALSNAGKQAMDMGYRPGTPEYTQVVQQLIEASLAQPYVGEGGETRLYTPQLGAQMQPPPPPQMQQQGGQEFTFEQYVGAVNGLGKQGADSWLQRNGFAVRVQTPDQARQLPSGTPIILPDGSQGRVP